MPQLFLDPETVECACAGAPEDLEGDASDLHRVECWFDVASPVAPVSEGLVAVLIGEYPIDRRGVP